MAVPSTPTVWEPGCWEALVNQWINYYVYTLGHTLHRRAVSRVKRAHSTCTDQQAIPMCVKRYVLLVSYDIRSGSLAVEALLWWKIVAQTRLAWLPAFGGGSCPCKKKKTQIPMCLETSLKIGDPGQTPGIKADTSTERKHTCVWGWTRPQQGPGTTPCTKLFTVLNW